MRAIIFLLLVVLVFFIVRFVLNRIIEIREAQNSAAEQDHSETTPLTEDMVRCAECGVHLPQSEAYYDGQDTFCSEGHMRAFHQTSTTANDETPPNA
ncbi:MAG: hypothetical protein GXO35_01115 [Gammaproteobacteria bacterium]|nr:hypothetical protein [Gammaproteobacteria bacterium]